jgi:hypothetical protein
MTELAALARTAWGSLHLSARALIAVTPAFQRQSCVG